MLSKIVLSAVLLVAACGAFVVEENKDEGDIWAVLVAGSDTWYNYRHQADVCHAYQILKQHGVSDDHIIVMMKDDIAQNPMNPDKGKIINRPDGPNVYEGVPKDYTGDTVTPSNFLKIIRGESMDGIGSGKTLKSGPNDRVFINLVDHGAPGIFGFPRGILRATELSAAIKDMNQAKLYKEMVIYLESCESGSMFARYLPSDINVYAVTASNSTSSSYACYYDKKLENFLGDVFSIKWMEDSDKEDLKTETLTDQFDIVKKETTTSPVQKFGQLGIMKEPVGDYQGISKKEDGDVPPFHDACLNSSMANPEVPSTILQRVLEAAETEDEKKEAKDQLIQFHKNREFVRDIIKTIALTITADPELTKTITNEKYVTPITDDDCYEESVQDFHDHCFNLGYNPYALRHVKVFNSLCEAGFSNQQIKSTIHLTCTHPPTFNIH